MGYLAVKRRTKREFMCKNPGIMTSEPLAVQSHTTQAYTTNWKFFQKGELCKKIQYSGSPYTGHQVPESSEDQTFLWPVFGLFLRNRERYNLNARHLVLPFDDWKTFYHLTTSPVFSYPLYLYFSIEMFSLFLLPPHVNNFLLSFYLYN